MPARTLVLCIYCSENPPSGASSPSGKKRARKAGAVSVGLIAGKVQAGRYRSTVAFESDARQMITQGKGPRSLSPEQVQYAGYRTLPCIY